ncbi:hypothetical protein PFISCL1PPCAC_14026, partial [Pristionchus fissidentatus]
ECSLTLIWIEWIGRSRYCTISKCNVDNRRIFEIQPMPLNIGNDGMLVEEAVHAENEEDGHSDEGQERIHHHRHNQLRKSLMASYEHENGSDQFEYSLHFLSDTCCSLVFVHLEDRRDHSRERSNDQQNSQDLRSCLNAQASTAAAPGHGLI